MCASHRLAALALVFVACAGPAFAQRDEIPARPEGGYSLDMLTSSQRERLDGRIDAFARVTGALNRCGRRIDVEKRVRAAVDGCVAPQSLAIVEERFRRTRLGVMVVRDEFCRDRDIVRLLPIWHKEVDEMIQWLREKCDRVRR